MENGLGMGKGKLDSMDSMDSKRMASGIFVEVEQFYILIIVMAI